MHLNAGFGQPLEEEVCSADRLLADRFVDMIKTWWTYYIEWEMQQVVPTYVSNFAANFRSKKALQSSSIYGNLFS